jgi:hypothetical protein
MLYINCANTDIKDSRMTDINFSLTSPVDVAQCAKTLRLEQNITPQELTDKVVKAAAFKNSTPLNLSVIYFTNSKVRMQSLY